MKGTITSQRAFLLAAAAAALLVSPSLRADGGRPGDTAGSAAVALLLEHHLEALGGAERIAALGSTRIVSSMKAFGFQGTSITWSRWPGWIRNELDLGLYSQVAAYDGESAWKLDQNGRTARLEGNEKRSLITDGMISSYLYCFPGKSGAHYRLIGEGKEDGRKTVALEVIPSDGAPIVLHFDAESHLIVKTEVQVEDIIAVTLFADYREVDGVRVPFYSRQSIGDPRFDIEQRVREVEFGLAAEDALFTFADVSPAPEDCIFFRGDTADHIPIQLANGHIYLDVTVNGEPGKKFLLDTGAAASVMNTSTAADQGFETFGRLQVIGAAGRGEASFTIVNSIRLPGLEMRNQRLMAVDLDHLMPYEGIPVDGILGYDFISRFVLKIDYEKGELCAFRPSAFRYDGDGEVVDIALEVNVPVVEATVEGDLPGRFLLDTGAGVALALNRPFVRAHRLLKGRKGKYEVYTGGVGGVVRQVWARLEWFQLGSFRFEEVPTVFSVADSEGTGGRRRLSGIIGGGLLRQFTVYLDYGNRRMMLEPNRFAGRPIPFDRSGIQLLLQDGEVLVAAVLKKSPARRAGIRPGDRIVAVNGVPAQELGLSGIRELFSGAEGLAVQIRVRHNGEEETVGFKLQAYR